MLGALWSFLSKMNTGQNKACSLRSALYIWISAIFSGMSPFLSSLNLFHALHEALIPYGHSDFLITLDRMYIPWANMVWASLQISLILFSALFYFGSALQNLYPCGFLLLPSWKAGWFHVPGAIVNIVCLFPVSISKKQRLVSMLCLNGWLYFCILY